MATIANLAVKISADGGNLEKTFQDVDKRIKKTEKSAVNFEAVFKGLKKGALILAAVVAAVVAMGVGVAKGVINDLQISRKIGDDIGSLEALRFALISVGAPAEKAGEILINLSKTLANSSVGLDAGAADALQRIGLNAQELARMKPSEALEEIAKKISEIPDASKRAALATQIFGENASDLLPILTKGTSAFDEARGSIDRLGGGIDNLKAAQLQQISIQGERLQAQLKIAAVTVLSELVPFFKMLSEFIGSAANAGLKFTDVVKVIGLTIGFFILALIEAFRIIKLVVQFVTLGFLGFAKACVWVVQKALELGAKLPDRLGGKDFKKAAESIKGVGDDLGTDMEDMCKNIDGNIDKIGTSLGKFKDMVKESVKKPFDAAGAAIEDTLGGKGAVKAANQFAELFNKGKELTNEMRTPLEKFNDKMLELNAMLEKGAISWDTYAKASADAVSQLEKAHELQSMSAPKAVLKNTVEAASAINAQNMRDVRFREKPEERVERVLKESQDIEKKQLEQLKKVAEGVQNQKIVKF